MTGCISGYRGVVGGGSEGEGENIEGVGRQEQSAFKVVRGGSERFTIENKVETKLDIDGDSDTEDIGGGEVEIVKEQKLRVQKNVMNLDMKVR